MTKISTPHVSYGVIPVFKGRQGDECLLLESIDGYWGFPKGHAEPGEKPKDTAVRETYEETGIIINKNELNFSVDYSYGQVINGSWQTKQIVLFPVEVTSKKVALQNSEIQSHKWVRYDEALSLVNLPDMAQALERTKKIMS